MWAYSHEKLPRDLLISRLMVYQGCQEWHLHKKRQESPDSWILALEKNIPKRKEKKLTESNSQHPHIIIYHEIMKKKKITFRTKKIVIKNILLFYLRTIFIVLQNTCKMFPGKVFRLPIKSCERKTNLICTNFAYKLCLQTSLTNFAYKTSLASKEKDEKTYMLKFWRKHIH